MSDIVKFPGAAKTAPRDDPAIWTCAKCGFYESGTTE